MFICNIKVNGNKLFKIILISFGVIALVIAGFAFYKVYKSMHEVFTVSDTIPHSNITEIDPKNYTNILKATHENIDSYVGKKIRFSGYIYRVLDFKDNQFVIARDMIVDSQAFVVGFLCEYNDIKKFEDGAWVEIEGTITKGSYHNQAIPVIKINSVNKINKPEDPYVGPPESTYIPTSSMF